MIHLKPPLLRATTLGTAEVGQKDETTSRHKMTVIKKDEYESNYKKYDFIQLSSLLRATTQRHNDWKLCH